jgi:hypothetical protein
VLPYPDADGREKISKDRLSVCQFLWLLHLVSCLEHGFVRT